jgi:hypothetical protein
LWDAVIRDDRPAAVRVVLEVAADLLGGSGMLGVLFGLGDHLQLTSDADVLTTFAEQGDERRWQWIAHSVRADDPAFWAFVSDWIRRRPEDTSIRGAFLARLGTVGPAWGGELKAEIERRKAAAEAIADSPTEPLVVRTFGRLAAAKLAADLGHDEVFDYRITRSELREYTNSEDEFLRSFAVSWILRHVPLGEVKAHLTREQIRDALPRSGLRESERRRWELILESWERTA